MRPMWLCISDAARMLAQVEYRVRVSGLLEISGIEKLTTFGGPLDLIVVDEYLEVVNTSFRKGIELHDHEFLWFLKIKYLANEGELYLSDTNFAVEAVVRIVFPDPEKGFVEMHYSPIEECWSLGLDTYKQCTDGWMVFSNECFGPIVEDDPTGQVFDNAHAMAAIDRITKWFKRLGVERTRSIRPDEVYKRDVSLRL